MAELLAPIVNFVIVVSVFAYFGRKPLLALFATRSEHVKKEMGEAEKAFGESSVALSQYFQLVSHKEEEAKKELEDTKASLNRFKERTLSSARTEAERIQKESQMMGVNEVNQAKESLQRELAEKSIYLVEDFLGKQLDKTEKEKLVTEYVELVGSGPS